MDTHKRVVVTGLGMVTPLACGVRASWRRLLAAESGVRRIDAIDVSDMPSRIAGQVPGPDAEDGFNTDDHIEPREQRRMDRFIHYALAAAAEAVDDAGWKPDDDESRERTGVLIGSGIGGLPGIEAATLTLAEKGPRRVSPFFIPSSLINLASGRFQSATASGGRTIQWSRRARPGRTPSATRRG